MLRNRLATLRADREDGEGGFTLIELLVVVVIIGVLVGIAIPLYLNYRKGANDKAAESDLRGAISTLEQCNSDNDAYPAGNGTDAYAITDKEPVTFTDCSAEKFNVSKGTTLDYYVWPDNNNSSYVLVSSNSGGNDNAFFCYNSALGGAIKPVSEDDIKACGGESIGRLPVRTPFPRKTVSAVDVSTVLDNS